MATLWGLEGCNLLCVSSRPTFHPNHTPSSAQHCLTLLWLYRNPPISPSHGSYSPPEARMFQDDTGEWTRLVPSLECSLLAWPACLHSSALTSPHKTLLSSTAPAPEASEFIFRLYQLQGAWLWQMACPLCLFHTCKMG